MATYTFYATANSGGGSSWNTGANYAYARQGNTANKGVAASTGAVSTGQLRANTYLYQCMEVFIEFDTSSLAGKSISSVQLQVYPTVLQNAASFIVEARLDDYGTTLEAADWVAGSNLASKTLLATLASSSAGINAYRTFTDVAFVANVNKTGKTRIVLASDQHRLNSAPANNVYEYVTIDGGDGGFPPKLIVVTNEVQGNASITLDAATLSATATLAISAAMSATLDDVTVSATGALSSTGAGSAVILLDDCTAAITVTTETHGYLDVVLDDLMLNTVALLDLNGNMSVTLDDVTLVAFGGKPITGNLSITLDDVILVANNQSGITGNMTVTLEDCVVAAAESTPTWPAIFGFPQAPLDGTWQTKLGDDTLRSEREIGARKTRLRNGGNYSEATFDIGLSRSVHRVEFDRFYLDACQNGVRAFYWRDPETGDIERWTWAAPPTIQHITRDRYIASCTLRKEAA